MRGHGRKALPGRPTTTRNLTPLPPFSEALEGRLLLCGLPIDDPAHSASHAPSAVTAVAAAAASAAPDTAGYFARINFQPAASPVPPNYLADGGSVYGNRGNGFSYGWDVSNTSKARDRDASNSPDQRYDTFNHLTTNGTIWEIAVPNGTYVVRVVSGDADHSDSVFKLNVEGNLTVDGIPTPLNRWVEGIRTVTVSDGKLTVTNALGAVNNKICFIDISTYQPDIAVPAFNSRPGAAAQLFLDFNGDYTPQWYSYQPGVTPAFDLDGDTASFNAQELLWIEDVYAFVAEAYSPFDLNVTTVDPGSLNDLQAQKVVIGGNGAWYGSAGGLGTFGGFHNSDPNVVWTFATLLWSAHDVGVVSVHEAGHGFDLDHQSIYDAGGIKTNEYNPGDFARAPIMGSAYLAERGLWWYGTSSISSTTYQDDLAVLSGPLNAFGYRADDHGNSTGSATALQPLGDSWVANGVIEQAADADFHSLTVATGGKFRIKVDVAPFGAMLDASFELRDTNGILIQQAATPNLNESLLADLDPGNYYLVVKGAGNYGDVGSYRLSATPLPAIVMTGTPGNDTYHVRTNEDGDTEVFVNNPNLNGAPDHTLPAGTALTIDAAAGGDVLTVLLDGGNALAALDYLAGPGDDELIVDMQESGPFITAGGNAVDLDGGLLAHSGIETLTLRGSDGSITGDLNGINLNLDLGQCSFTATVHVNHLTLSPNTTVYPTGTGPAGLLVMRSFDFQPGAALDLAELTLLIDYDDGPPSPLGSWSGSAYTGVTGLIQNGDIDSSAANGTLVVVAATEARDALGLSGTQTALWLGQTVDTTAVLVQHTWGGDANLDGKINIDDYGQIDFNIAQASPLKAWFHGDFNLDGKINIDDYGIIDFNVNAQTGPATGPVTGAAVVAAGDHRSAPAGAAAREGEARASAAALQVARTSFTRWECVAPDDPDDPVDELG